jgi:hypothetical protein
METPSGRFPSSWLTIAEGALLFANLGQIGTTLCSRRLSWNYHWREITNREMVGGTGN